MKHSYPVHENDFLNKLEAGDQDGLHEALEKIVPVYVDFTLDSRIDMNTRQSLLLVLDSKMTRHALIHQGNEFIQAAISNVRSLVSELKSMLKSEMKQLFKTKAAHANQLSEEYTDTPPPKQRKRPVLCMKDVAIAEKIYFEWIAQHYKVDAREATLVEILEMYREYHGVTMTIDELYDHFRSIKTRKGKSRIPMHNEKENIPNRAYYHYGMMHLFNEYIRSSEGQDGRTTEKPNIGDHLEGMCV